MTSKSPAPGKLLVIAEKPSVASDIAKALGGFEKESDYFEGPDMVVGSAVGHLLEIVPPEGVEVKRGKWSFAHLPVIPDAFDLKPLPKSEQRLKLLARLLKRKDVAGVINACDAGREGELIFRLIMQYTKSKLPIQRLWLQSMTAESIREAFRQLRTDEDLQSLANAARCRSEADWLVGINGTRAMTAFNSKDGGFFLTTVGRVQTPSLSILVDREDLIRRFQAKTYFEITAGFDTGSEQYVGKWFDPSFSKSDDNSDARADRLWERKKAEAVMACLSTGMSAKVSEETKPSSQSAPMLFDLTSLQREANARFGFSAKASLGLTQALYEKHKAVTYPRTDSKALPEDYIETVINCFKGLSKIPDYKPFASQLIAEKRVIPNKKIFNNAKISDHFAIFPTGQIPKSLTEPEAKIFDLIVRRSLAVFFPAAEFLNTTRISEISSNFFKTEGKVLKSAGWMAVYGKTIDEQPFLPPLPAGQGIVLASHELHELQTKPPPRYSEATLLSAMEGAGRFVDDEEKRDAMSGKGLGTPATRAAIIEELIAKQYVVREGRELTPTAKAFQLMTLLRGLGVDSLSKAELTGDWEFKLKEIELGQRDPTSFMQEISELTHHIVDRARNYNSETIPGDYATLSVACPKCGGSVVENYRRYSCQACDFSFTKIPGARILNANEAESFIKERRFGPTEGFRGRTGFPFVGTIVLTPEFKLEFDFGNKDEDQNAEPVSFEGQSAIGPCPKCQSSVFEYGNGYVCEKSVGPERSCDFKSGLSILQQMIDRAEMAKLLSEKKTSLLTGFVSNRTKRKFKAFLTLGPEGKVGFEFAAKKAKAS